MINVFHGENIVQSRKAMWELIEKLSAKSFNSTRLEGAKISLNDLIFALESKTLFKDKNLLVIENFFSLPNSNNKQEMIDCLLANLEADVLIWEAKEISPSVLTKYTPKFNFKNFKLSSFLFSFLDKLNPGAKKMNLENLHKCFLTEEPEMIFAMLVRQMRFLILAKESEKFLGKLATWQKNKFLSQAKLFKTESLKEIYKKLLIMDFGLKTSQTAFDLSASLDLFVSEI